MIDATPDALAEAAREVAELVDRNRGRQYIDGTDADRFDALDALARAAKFYALSPDREPVDAEVEARPREQAYKQRSERTAAEAEARRQAKFAEQQRLREAARAARRTPASQANAARAAEARQRAVDEAIDRNRSSLLGPR